MLSYTEWNNLLNLTILFYKTLNHTIYRRQKSFIKAHPSGSIEIELPVKVNSSAMLEWSSEIEDMGFFIPQSPFITKAGLHQTEDEKKAYQRFLLDLTATLNKIQQ